MVQEFCVVFWGTYLHLRFFAYRNGLEEQVNTCSMFLEAFWRQYQNHIVITIRLKT